MPDAPRSNPTPTPGDVTPPFGRLAAAAAQTPDHPIGDKLMRLRRRICGAYVREPFDGEALDLVRWAFMSDEKGVVPAVRDGRLIIAGETDSGTTRRRFLGIHTVETYPDGAVLVARMQPVSGLFEVEKVAYVIHLCGRDPDHNAEITYARTEKGAGWYNWYLDHTGFFKWDTCVTDPLPPFGDEGASMQTVLVEHNAETHESRGFLIRGGEWIQVGRTQRMITHFSAPEIKIDTEATGTRVEMHVDDVRMYPHPAHSPVKIVALRTARPGPAPRLYVAGVRLQLRFPDGREIEGVTDRAGAAALALPTDLVYPTDAEVTARIGQDLTKTARIEKNGLAGLYPGDVWVADLD